MILNIDNKEGFVNNFLGVLSKINDAGVVRINKNGLSSLLATEDESLILHIKYDLELDIDGQLDLNIPDFKKLVKILNCIDLEKISLSIDANHISYESNDIRFKYHLLEDGILNIPKITIDKIKQLTFNTNFNLPNESLINLLRGSTFSIDSNKLYLFTKEKSVYGELTDKQLQNIDSVTIKLNNEFTGDFIDPAIPLNFENIRIISNTRCENIKTYVNIDLKVLMFKIQVPQINIIYIAAGILQ